MATRIGTVSIGLGCLAPESEVFVSLPKGIMLYCSQCGRECIGSKCTISFCVAPEAGLKQQVRLRVNCLLCGCYGESPSLESSKRSSPMKIPGNGAFLGAGG